VISATELQKSYEILGLSQDASVNEIKRAFREKAKKMHPDVNAGKHAHDQFVSIQKAYENLVDYKTGKLHLRYQSRDPIENIKTEAELRREAFKRKYAEEARRKHEEYVNSDIYKIADALEVVFMHIYLIFGFFLFLAIATVLVVIFKYIALLILGIAMFFGIKPLLYFIKTSEEFDIPRLLHSIKYLGYSIGALLLTFVVIINILLFRYAPKTLILYSELTISYLISMAVPFVLIRFLSKKFSLFRHVFIPFCIGPIILSVLLMINYNFSSNPTTETYRFKRELQYDSQNKLSPSDYIILEDNAYQDFHQIRDIPHEPRVFLKTKITYNFEEGLLGYRVVKGVSFE